MVSGPAPNGLSATPCVVALTHDAALHRATRGMTHCARERVPGCSADTAHRVSSPTFRGSVCLSSTHKLTVVLSVFFCSLPGTRQRGDRRVGGG